MGDEFIHTFKIICAFLVAIPIVTHSLILSIVFFIVTILLLIYKIKSLNAKPPEVYSATMLDIILLILVIIFYVAYFVMAISSTAQYSKIAQSTVNSELEEWAEHEIATYKLTNQLQFSDKKDHQKQIKNGFLKYLKEDQEDSGFNTIKAVENDIICEFDDYTVTFTIRSSSIKYSVK